MIDFSTFKENFNDEYFVPEVPLSKDYKVFIGDREVPVYTCRISKVPYNVPWPGHQRNADLSELVSYINVVSDEDVTLRVIPTKNDYDKAFIKPYSKNVKVNKNADGELSFTLKSHGGYTLNLDDFHGCLYVFNSPFIPCEDKSKVTYYFDKGIHFVGKLELKSNESVYVDKDAIVYGNVYAEHAENVKVYGNGIFDDSLEERVYEKIFGINVGNARFIRCNNVKIEGVGFMNSAIWCINIYACKNVEIDGIKVFGQWKYNTDGIDLLNCANVIIKNTFVQSFDDSIVLKAFDVYSDISNEHITVENCTIECQWGRALEIGLETSCREYNDILFKNIDVIRPGGIVCDIQNGDCAEVHDVTFDDIRVEYESYYTKETLQWGKPREYSDAPYPNADKIQPFRLFMMLNIRFRDYYKVDGRTTYQLQKGDERFAGTHDVTIKNVSIYASDKVIETLGKNTVLFEFVNLIETTKYSNVTVKDVTLNGKKLKSSDVTIKYDGCGIFENFNILND